MKRLKRHKPSNAGAELPIVDINTTPLIDVMMVLLIMLIITIPVQLHAVKLNLPQGQPPHQQQQPDIVRIDIDATDVIRWNGTVVAPGSALEHLMTAEAARVPQPEVHLRPDRKARYALVASVLSSAQRTGLSRIGVVGSEQFIQ
jgi:biopolymer transport protein ExbD